MSDDDQDPNSWRDLAFSIDVMLANESAREDQLGEPQPAAVQINRSVLQAVLTGQGLVSQMTYLLWQASQQLTVEFDRLRDELVAQGRAVLMPAVAAAASQPMLSERHFSGGAVSLGADTARPNQMYLVVTNADGRSEPASIAARSADRKVNVVMPITKHGINGMVQIILDTNIERDADLARLVQDPTSEIVIVWRA